MNIYKCFKAEGNTALFEVKGQHVSCTISHVGIDYTKILSLVINMEYEAY